MWRTVIWEMRVLGGCMQAKTMAWRRLRAVHHVGVADGFFGAAFAEGELGFGAAGADGAYVDVVGAEFGVEGLGEAYLGEF